jgi:ElaB/YqjD/DUF883 family membrane-anchored ribosome-binding protein
MASAVPVTPTRNNATLRNRAIDAVRQATHVAHEARLIKTLATDAVEDRVHATRRAITRRMRNLEDMRDTAVHGIKRSPTRAIGMAFGAGILLGVVSRSMTRARTRVRTRKA